MTGLMVNICLLALLVVIVVMVMRTHRLFAVVVLSGAYSLICAVIFVNLDAVDVAFTEAAVGAGISTVLFCRPWRCCRQLRNSRRGRTR